MKKSNQIFIFILCVSLLIIQVTAQTNSVNDRANQNSINQKILDKYEQSAVRIKRHWQLINKTNGKQIYFLYVPVKTLKQKGIQMMSQAEAVPVYVENDSGSFEPVLVEDKGKYNVPVEDYVSAGGFDVTTDGFILTSRRVAAPWHSVKSYEGSTIPPGIILSADLKKISTVDSAPPVDWIPSHTKPQRGMIANLGIKADFNYENISNKIEIKVAFHKGNELDAQLVSSSDQHEVGLIKVKIPGELKAPELYDNYDLLKKDSADNFIVFTEKTGLTIMKILVNKTYSDEMGNTIQLIDKFSGPKKETAEESRSFFTVFSNSSSGNPVFDSKGRVIGIYLGYNANNYTHNIVPIRFGKELLQ